MDHAVNASVGKQSSAEVSGVGSSEHGGYERQVSQFRQLNS
jgi:hypothetical protein